MRLVLLVQIKLQLAPLVLIINSRQVTRTTGTDDVWLVRTNRNGDLIKQLCYGGRGSESTFDLGMTEGLMIAKDGTILFAGETNSNDGDVHVIMETMMAGL